MAQDPASGPATGVGFRSLRGPQPGDSLLRRHHPGFIFRLLALAEKAASSRPEDAIWQSWLTYHARRSWKTGEAARAAAQAEVAGRLRDDLTHCKLAVTIPVANTLYRCCVPDDGIDPYGLFFSEFNSQRLGWFSAQPLHYSRFILESGRGMRFPTCELPTPNEFRPSYPLCGQDVVTMINRASRFENQAAA